MPSLVTLVRFSANSVRSARVAREAKLVPVHVKVWLPKMTSSPGAQLGATGEPAAVDVGAVEAVEVAEVRRGAGAERRVLPGDQRVVDHDVAGPGPADRQGPVGRAVRGDDRVAVRQVPGRGLRHRHVAGGGRRALAGDRGRLDVRRCGVVVRPARRLSGRLARRLARYVRRRVGLLVPHLLPALGRLPDGRSLVRCRRVGLGSLPRWGAGRCRGGGQHLDQHLGAVGAAEQHRHGPALGQPLVADPATAEEGAVGRLQVHEVPASATAAELGVPAGHVGVHDDDGERGVPTERDDGIGELPGLPGHRDAEPRQHRRVVRHA